MLTQLNPPLPLETSKGPGWAHFVIDYGPESALLWVVFMDADGACWTSRISRYACPTIGRWGGESPAMLPLLLPPTLRSAFRAPPEALEP